MPLDEIAMLLSSPQKNTSDRAKYVINTRKKSVDHITSSITTFHFMVYSSVGSLLHYPKNKAFIIETSPGISYKL